jgi:hypothetical protein
LLEFLDTKLLLNEQPTIRQSDRDHRTESIQLSDQSIDSNAIAPIDISGEREPADEYITTHCVVDLEDPGDAVEYEKAKAERLKLAIECFREKNPQPRVPLPRFISDLAEDIKRGIERQHQITGVAIGIAERVTGANVRKSNRREEDGVSGSVRLPRKVKQVD